LFWGILILIGLIKLPLIKKITQLHDLIQMVKGPTQNTATLQNLLDLIFTNKPDLQNYKDF